MRIIIISIQVANAVLLYFANKVNIFIQIQAAVNGEFSSCLSVSYRRPVYGREFNVTNDVYIITNRDIGCNRLVCVNVEVARIPRTIQFHIGIDEVITNATLSLEVCRRFYHESQW